ncbi:MULTISPECIES: DUF262 domain-containing protein [Planktothrix]|jgi:uncharacterized protein with ParB-like and HNH nuclease domain|uniref:DUF262 domain-containing protein n=1 Tax=Planktothrix agardhii (strain NIVA-CYA 126/8) TaxID=388467 RepID=A0A073CFN1_PLAA1|nr:MULTISPECIES: DUF262 domain-containing protein [Planktothrix]KEI66926.1 hypothetical protein A19Y_1951 [Planktothrix agardhii NIVA-CYA 126/8]CAD5960817.1 hypothetical protein NIVACYA_03619 [Planktothrix agardhii]
MAELNVTKKSISSLFSEMQGTKFIIPDYQRPYKWDLEKCEILWQDLTSFFEESTGNEEYYLGTVVTCKNDESGKTEIEVIDGQQRITSLLLLLRAFYSKLENSAIEDDNITGLKNQIAPCIWDVNPISGRVSNTSLIHIESRVATESDKEIFHTILQSGKSKPNATDLYSKNYHYFFSMCEEYAKNNPMSWQGFCVCILKNCIILPIDCEKLDTALTIFSTLNDRGMPLSDSDIFKAQIYRTKNTEEEKSEFTNSWRELTETVDDAGMTLDALFRNYSHVIRGRNGDRTKEIALRKFYAGEKFEKLKQPNLMKELQELAEFWLTVKQQGESKFQGREFISHQSFKYFHCLNHYPNEYWKYVTSAYFFKNKDSDSFHTNFSEYLGTLVSFLFFEFVQKPTVNAIKDSCYQFCIDIFEGKPLTITASISSGFSITLAQTVNYKIARAMILLHAYLNPNQIELIESNFEIEHIFPRVWQAANYNGWNHEDAKVYLERYGNKVAIGKKLNIQAGNGYFGQKKNKYKDSPIANVNDLSKYPSDDWVKTDIEAREKLFLESIVGFFHSNLHKK